MVRRHHLIKLSSVASCISHWPGLPHDSQQLHPTLPGVETGRRSPGPDIRLISTVHSVFTRVREQLNDSNLPLSNMRLLHSK